MHGDRPDERASTLLEAVGLGAVVLLLVTAIGTGLGVRGASVGETVGTRVAEAAAGRTEVRRSSTTAPRMLTSGSMRGAWEARRGGGTLPARVGRSDLRVSSAAPATAAWKERRSSDGTLWGAAWELDARACAACVGVGFEHAIVNGGFRERGAPAQVGVRAEGSVGAHVAAGAGDVSASVRRSVGPATVEAQVAARALVGADAEAAGVVHLGPHRQQLEVRGSAMAGAVARVRGRAGVELLGVAISQSGSVEGWAGAGARGVASVSREAGRISWQFGWGAALGIGGAGEWSGSVDATRVPERHRRLAATALRTAAAAAFPAIGGIAAARRID